MNNKTNGNISTIFPMNVQKNKKEANYMNKKRLQDLVEKNKIIHFEDDSSQQDIWNEMIKILSNNLEETITYLDSASKEEIYYISSIYDDLSERFKSKELIECMKRNATKTGVDCNADIEFALKTLNEK